MNKHQRETLKQAANYLEVKDMLERKETLIRFDCRCQEGTGDDCMIDDDGVTQSSINKNIEIEESSESVESDGKHKITDAFENLGFV
ncbi:hypothetical protein R1flu_022071 [Riccia fluitans]|uniref:Uncharacterized protein n=1 Tax=Riccia fluitans TaxID=41844 RepID=A0ABD1ZRD0_9MARC